MIQDHGAHPRVAILHYTSPSVVGGVESVMAAHASLLAEHGYQVTILAGRGTRLSGAEYDLQPLLDSKNEEVLAVHRELDKSVVSPSFHDLENRIAGDLRSALDGTGICIVHNALTLHKNLPLTSALHRVIKEGISTRFIAWCHDVAWVNPIYLPQLHPVFPFTLLRTPLSQVTYVTVSEMRRRELAQTMELPLELVTTIPNGISPQKFLKLTRAGWHLARELALLDQEVVMLLPARITRRKNIELAIQVTKALVDNGIRAKLIVTGPPGPHNVRSFEYVDSLRCLRDSLSVNDEVIFLHEKTGEKGRKLDVTDSVMTDLYQLSDILIFPSSQEGFGIPLLEAGLGRLPIFCSNITPFREIGEGLAEFFDLDDQPESIAQRISELLRHDRRYRLRQRVLRSYTWPAIFREHIGPLLDNVIRPATNLPARLEP